MKGNIFTRNVENIKRARYWILANLIIGGIWLHYNWVPSSEVSEAAEMMIRDPLAPLIWCFLMLIRYLALAVPLNLFWLVWEMNGRDRTATKVNLFTRYVESAGRGAFWILANIIVIGAWLHADSQKWAPLGRGGIDPDFIAFGLTFYFYMGPVVFLNVVWLAVIGWSIWKKREWYMLGIFAFVMILWDVALWYGASRH